MLKAKSTIAVIVENILSIIEYGLIDLLTGMPLLVKRAVHAKKKLKR